MKTLRAKKLGGSQNFFLCELYQLFSSFLRGASRPKSPRDAVLTATVFMPEVYVIVKIKVSSTRANNNLLTFCVKGESTASHTGTPGQTAS